MSALIVQLILFLFLHVTFSITIHNHHNIVHNSLSLSINNIGSSQGSMLSFLIVFTIYKMNV